uniref:Aldehyde dehydrogenase n=1 Tax=uncultured bacterium 246 TaxID=698384 RepID=E3T6D6_9BACT|nr:aldehyde dehydrogenase [uncultured bacterium 246]
MDVEKIYKNFINGEWVESRSGNVLENRNPANVREMVGIFQSSDTEDVDRAVEAAAQAFRTWRLTPAPRRAEILFRAAHILEERKESLAQEMTREMGKVLVEARGDVQEAIDMTYYMAGEGRRMYGQTTPSELPDKFAMSVRMPMGVCGLITPWNFPMAIPSWKIIPALICGNTVVIKPAEDTPLSCLNLIQILTEAGLPRGVVNMVTGHGPTAGEPLALHPGVHMVSFTGSTEVGRHIAQICAPTFKHSNLEMGGKNVLIVMDDADLELAVDGAVWGGFGTSGQRCTAASRVVVHKRLYKEFVGMLVERAEALKVGDPLDPATQMGPVINREQLQRVHSYVDIGTNEGARLMCGGHIMDQGGHACGFFHQPTVFSDVAPGMRIAQEEIFGPVVALIPCDGLEQAIEIGNGVRYGLSASIYTQDVNRAFAAMRDMYTGIFYVNASTIGAEIHLPFGGTKETGNGHREAGTAALDVFSEWKSIYVDYSGRLQRAQIDTFTP